MTAFNYKAKDRGGKFKTGRLEAQSTDAARAKLRSMSLTPITLKAVKAGGDKVSGGLFYKDDKGNYQINIGDTGPSTKELALFTKQFSIMLERGVPLVQTLGILGTQQKSRKFCLTIIEIKKKVENGASLSDAMAHYSSIFDVLYVSIIRAGEISGRLDVVLRMLQKYIERIAKLKAQIRKAMTYPSMVLIIAMVIMSGLLIYVVPTFAEQYATSNNELPELTQLVIDISEGFQAYFAHMVGGLVLAAVLGHRALQNESTRSAFDGYILRAPIIGNVMQKIAVSRFCATMSTMLTSGVPILEALNICASSSGNKRIENFVREVRDAIAGGQNFSDPLRRNTLFPQMVVSMISVGEQTGALDETMAKITEIYEDEVDQSISIMTSMIEPLMMVVIGGMVGFVMLAMYLPVFDMAGNA